MGLIRGALDDAYDVSVTNKIPLRNQLRVFETQARNSISQGSLSHVGMGGRSTGFSNYGQGQVTPAQWQLVWRFLIDNFDAVFARLAQFEQPKTDPAVKAELNCELVAVTQSYPDFSEYDLPKCVPGLHRDLEGVLTW
jgi:hypothetical protein